MIIQDIIRGVVSTMVVPNTSTPPTFIQGNDGYQNLQADEITNDIIILDWPIVSNDDYKQGGLLEENYTVNILFLTKSEFDNMPDQHEVLIARMREQRRVFLNKLSTYATGPNKAVRSFGSIKTIDLVNIFNSNRSGVMLSLRITPLNPLPKC